MSKLPTLLLGLLPIAGCDAVLGIEDHELAPDAGTALDGTVSDSSVDRATDAGVDSATDASVDSATDASAEGAPDATLDSAVCAPNGTGVVGTLGCPCSAAGSLACNGNAQKVTLICTGGAWATNGTCGVNQLCDSAVGINAGTCQTIDPVCAGAIPGAQVCGTTSTVVQCGPDLVSDTPVTTCNSETCVDGACGGVCAPGQQQCADDTHVETCGADGGWAVAACPTGCCGGACADLTSDPHNCNRCGHDCQGGACTASACQPVVLVPGQCGTQGIAVDATSVYWTDYVTPGAVNKVPLDGGTVTTLASGLQSPLNLAVNATSVYWTEAGGWVYQVPLDGGAVEVVAKGQLGTVGIALDATNVYWTNQNGGTVVTAPLAGVPDGGSPTVLASGQGEPNDVAVDGTNIYWTDYSGGTVMQAPLSGVPDGGSPITLASGFSQPVGIAIDSTSVYWCNADGQSVLTVPIGGVPDGGPPTTLRVGPATVKPWYIAVDASGAYWTSSGNEGRITMIPIDGGTATDIAVIPDTSGASTGPLGIALDATTVYWAQNGVAPADGGACLGAVMKLAKP